MDHLKSELEEIANLCKSVNIENQELEKEINSLVRAADDVVVLVYSRRCLEVIITDICETTLDRDRGTEPLKGIIDKLSKEKLIPAFVLTAMQNVNNNSTYGAHPKDFDKRQVRSTLIDLTTVLDWYFFEFKKLEKKAVVPTTTAVNEETKAEKDITKEPVIKNKSISKEPTKKAGSKPVLYIGIIILVVAIGVAIYFGVVKKTNMNEGTIAKTQDSITTSIKKDSLPAADTKKIEGVKPENKDQVIAKDNKEILKTKKIEPLDLPDDLEKALNIMNDKSISSEKKKATIPILCKRFTPDAQVVLLNANGFYQNDWQIKDYLTSRIVSSSLFNIKVVSLEKEGNKIKILKVEHNK